MQAWPDHSLWMNPWKGGFDLGIINPFFVIILCHFMPIKSVMYYYQKKNVKESIKQWKEQRNRKNFASHKKTEKIVNQQVAKSQDQ